ncbi:hypothetical protein RS130_12665 [Paraglaciecola aquimarina]|uniref:Uncharacterized protein n=1 Tax=Paraglaciecola aquimarina TaxID=1235557 RepID=A0ABU3SXC7_9ALTE|nr:hypothetical protein [Paraglaciecola aquimarina]MDU0354656.1 hypothetical protein [Paraglaciecola aquimarina]
MSGICCTTMSLQVSKFPASSAQSLSFDWFDNPKIEQALQVVHIRPTVINFVSFNFVVCNMALFPING